MSHSAKRTISLPPEQDDYIRRAVTAGNYASASEVVRAGLRVLQDRDAMIEDWLAGQVAEAYDRLKKEPNRVVSSQDLRAAVAARHRKAVAE